MKKKKKKNLLKITINLTAIMFVFLLFFGEYNSVYRECYVEAGVRVSPQDFFRSSNGEVAFSEKSAAINTKVPGEYPVILKRGIFSHKSTLHVSDTIAPEAQVVNVSLGKGDVCEADAFVADVVDATEVTIEYIKKPDFSIMGKQQVEVRLKDLGENETLISAQLTIAPVRSEVLVEAGSEAPTIDEFIIRGSRIEEVEAEFVTDISGFDYTILAEYGVDIKVDEGIYTSNLRVVDTIAPMVQVQNLQGYLNVPYKADDFVLGVEDVTEVVAEFAIEPDVTKEGEQQIAIRVKDAGGNETVKNVKLTIARDTEAPVIEGVDDIYVFLGDTVAYKSGVTVTDNCPQELKLEVDSSNVNLKEAGTYPITYTAKDYAGNKTKATANVIVKERVYNEEELNSLADKVLAKILKEGMSPYEKAEAIYNYTRKNIRYISNSQKEDWVRAAYEGLVDKKGDCYVYACTAKVLLTRAGITNMDIEKIPAKTLHYWNLVDLGDGWYHFDTTPRKDGVVFFMWSEKDLMDYSERNNKSHNYDHSLYPVVN